ncbi:hypothetical protein D4S03_05505 [bacterium]|nr:MAG: hypothetical protein D4S03_05505 [bacterium]
MQKPQKSPKIMSNKPLPWPYQAKEARDRSAEEAMYIVNQLKPLIDGVPMVEADWVRRVARAVLAAETILRHLEMQGAPTRPL